MKKVLFVATVTKHINAFHIPYLKWFKEQGYEVHVASNGDEGIEYCDKHFNMPFERFPFKYNNLKTYKQLKELIEKNKYEIIHCHTPVGGVLTRLAARKARKEGTKVIYTAHGFHFYKGAPLLNWIIYYPIEKYLSKYTDVLITINQEDYDVAKNKFRSKHIELVHGVGVDEKKFDFEFTIEEKHELRVLLGLKDNDFLLIQVGELNKNKNQIMSINAMRELVEKNNKLHLLLVGTGPLENFYKQKIEEFNLKNNVHLLGYRKDISKLLKSSNLLLSLSYREGLPVNVIEAIFCHLPIIVTDCRGNIDLANNYNKSSIIKINDINMLEEKIIECYNKKYELKDVDITIYSENKIRERMEKIYTS